jgi:hypothetical protein
MNCTDEKQRTGIVTVIEAFVSESIYQLKRWGYRQSDGSVREAEHPLADWLVYMDDYLHAAFHLASTTNGNSAALDMLRKVICLAWACAEQDGQSINTILAALDVRREADPPMSRGVVESAIPMRPASLIHPFRGSQSLQGPVAIQDARPRVKCHFSFSLTRQ